MWFDPVAADPDWRAAVRHLRRSGPEMAAVVDYVGPCTLAPRRDYFVVLCKAIYTQQIATTVATVLFGRFRDLFPSRRPTPARTIELLTVASEETLRHVGLSRQKRKYVLDLAQHFVDGRIPTRRLGRMDDEAVIQTLTAVHGIGRWTAELFLIFTLNRPDVLPIDDLGLWESARLAFALPQRPTRAELSKIAEPWRPWRTVASWYLWKYGAMKALAAKEAKAGLVFYTRG